MLAFDHFVNLLLFIVDLLQDNITSTHLRCSFDGFYQSYSVLLVVILPHYIDEVCTTQVFELIRLNYNVAEQEEDQVQSELLDLHLLLL